MRGSEPHEPKRWRWLTRGEREIPTDERDRRFAWVRAGQAPMPSGRRGGSWRIEVELNNGQRIFYAAY